MIFRARTFAIIDFRALNFVLVCQDRTARTEHPEQESQKGTGRTRMPLQDSQNMKARTGRNVTGRTGKAEQNGKTEKDKQNRTDIPGRRNRT